MPVWFLTGLGAARNIAKGAFTWITANTTHLLAVILAISALWGLYERHEATKYHRALESCSAARKSDQANLKTSNASIDLLQSKIAEQNADTERRAAEYASAQKQAENDSRVLAERAKGSDALIQRLKARASQKGSGCPVPADLRREAQGL